MRSLFAVAGAVLLAACPTMTTSTPPTPPPDVGRLIAVSRAGTIDVEIDASIAPLAVAATVKVQGARITGPATLGAAGADRDLFEQKSSDGEVRFAVSDSRALRIQRSGVLLRIPVDANASSVVITAVTAANEDGNEVVLQGFSGVPEARQ